MIRWVRDTSKAIWLFFKFAAIIVVGYLLLIALLSLLRHPTLTSMTQSTASAADFWGRVETAVKVIGVLFLSTTVLHFLDRYLLGGRLIARWSLASGASFSFIRMFTFPFIHKDNTHLVGNVPFLLLFASLAVILLPSAALFSVILVMFLIQGLGVWLFGGKNTAHIGMSGLVLGFFSFDVLYGFFSGGWMMVVALVILLLWGRRMLKSLFNRQPGISVAGHVWGFLSGVFAAYMLSPFGFLPIG